MEHTKRDRAGSAGSLCALRVFIHVTMLSLLCAAIPTRGVVAQTDDEDCLSCHRDAAKVKSVLDPELLKKSIHADLSCIDCHDSIEDREHPPTLPSVNCGNCHEDQEKEYKGSVHDLAKVENIKERPGCKPCHGTHGILPKKNKLSSINPQNISNTCGQCHSKPDIMARFGSVAINPVALYQMSTHARVLQEHPEKNPATCTDCHSSHAIYPPLNPKSTFSKFAIPTTCGKCHEKESKEYQQSVHWEGVSHGHYEAPVCYDCHGEHAASVPHGEGSKVLASTRLCANCHSNDVMMARFGLDAKRFATYLKTYHGLAVLRGSVNAASCVSCHEVHSIRSKTDPASTVNPANLAVTCGRCHQQASSDFVKVSVHPLNLQERNPIAYMFRVFYIWLIAVVIGGMLIHNLIIVCFYLIERWREHSNHQQVRRFSMFQVIQHVILLVSFTALAVTGFALVFSESAWAQLLSFMGMTEPVRASTHRSAAVVLMLSSFVQGVWFVFFRSGRREILSLIPRWSDVTGFWQNMRYYLRLSDEHPQFGRFDYTEKAEYLALIWGTLVMAVTGLVLWFPERALNIFPVWTFEVSEVIHLFEAALAVSAIVVWHLFFTIFHPEKYPMSMTWFDGKVSRHEQEEHHSLEDQQEPKK